MNFFAELALIPGGWAKNVRVTLDQTGRIVTVESGVEPDPNDQILRSRILLPAMSNLHSHSFQRAMSGLTEKRLEKRDSFWNWRELMDSFLARLTPEEMELVKRHPIYSREILEPVRFLEEALPLVYHHHERYDGGGYPDGIAGEDIPEGARIISVCDTYDAMRSTRSYRTSRPEHRILEIIEKERGKQLDARYVDLFLEHLDEIRPENVNQIHEESVFACV